MYKAVLYSLCSIPIEEQCQDQVEDLYKKYGTRVSGQAGRISIDLEHHHVVVQHDGVAAKLVPWELHTSMLHRRLCRFEDAGRSEIFFEKSQFPRLPVNGLLKSLVIDELLGDPGSG
jgi:hypothetical protein